METLCDGRVEKRAFPPKDRFEKRRISYYGSPRDLIRIRVATPKQVIRGERAWKSGGWENRSSMYWRSYFDANGMVELLIVEQDRQARLDAWHWSRGWKRDVASRERLAMKAHRDTAFQRFLTAVTSRPAEDA